MQFLLAVGTPQDSAVKGAAVGKTVRHTADVHGTTLAEVVCRHLHFFVSLHQHFGALKGVDVLFALAKVHGLVGVLQNEMVRVFFPVVFVCIEIKSSFFLYSQDIIQLKEFSLPISMSFRMFGALLSGLLVTELVYYYVSLSFVVPVVVGVLFTLLHALIQAYVLTTLTSMFYGETTEKHAPKPKKSKKIKAETVNN